MILNQRLSRSNYESPKSLGQMHEEKFLGTIHVDNRRYKKIIQRLIDAGKERISTPLNLEEALEDIREVYKLNNLDPEFPDPEKQPFLSDLRYEIIDLLEEEGLWDVEKNQLKVYSSIASGGVRTPLDINHGVDFFIDFCDRYGVEQTITGDVSLKFSGPENVARESAAINEQYEYKLETAKADVLVPEIPDPTQATDKYLEFISQIAQSVIKKYKD